MACPLLGDGLERLRGKAWAAVVRREGLGLRWLSWLLWLLIGTAGCSGCRRLLWLLWLLAGCHWHRVAVPQQRGL